MGGHTKGQRWEVCVRAEATSLNTSFLLLCITSFHNHSHLRGRKCHPVPSFSRNEGSEGGPGLSKAVSQPRP